MWPPSLRKRLSNNTYSVAQLCIQKNFHNLKLQGYNKEIPPFTDQPYDLTRAIHCYCLTAHPWRGSEPIHFVRLTCEAHQYDT